MSKIPTPPRAFDSPKGAFKYILKNTIALKPATREAIVKSPLLAFIAHPTTKELLGHNDDTPSAQPGNSNNPELQQIQETLVQLTNAVEALKKSKEPASNKSGPNTKQKASAPSMPTCHTYSAAAGSRPPNPSLVVDLADLILSCPENWLKLETTCRLLNDGLSKISPPQVQLAAIRWTAKGNLVVTSGPSSTPQTLQTAAPHISAILALALKISPSFIPQPRANVKWSKILINGVPTGASEDREPYSPGECHAALATINPTYARLTITQKPSWVRPPTSYQPGAASSLSLAFEDPDGTNMKTPLEDKYLYLFGHRVAVKKWKQNHRTTKGTPRKSGSETAEIAHHHHTATAAADTDTTTPPVPLKANARLEEIRNVMSNPNPNTNSPRNTPTPAARANPPRRAKGNRIP